MFIYIVPIPEFVIFFRYHIYMVVFIYNISEKIYSHWKTLIITIKIQANKKKEQKFRNFIYRAHIHKSSKVLPKIYKYIHNIHKSQSKIYIFYIYMYAYTLHNVWINRRAKNVTFYNKHTKKSIIYQTRVDLVSSSLSLQVTEFFFVVDMG